MKIRLILVHSKCLHDASLKLKIPKLKIKSKSKGMQGCYNEPRNMLVDYLKVFEN